MTAKHSHDECTYLEVLVAGLLVLLGHGGRGATGEEAGNAEEDTGNTNTQHDVHEDPGALAGRSLSTGAVRAEGDPVGWKVVLVCSPLAQKRMPSHGFLEHSSCVADGTSFNGLITPLGRNNTSRASRHCFQLH